MEKRGNQTRWEPRATNVGHRLVFEKDIRTGEGPITLLLMLFILYGHDQTRPFILSLRSVPCRHPYSPRGAISVCRESFCMSHFYLFLSLSLSLSLSFRNESSTEVTSTSLCQKYRLTLALPITYTYIYIWFITLFRDVRSRSGRYNLWIKTIRVALTENRYILYKIIENGQFHLFVYIRIFIRFYWQSTFCMVY